MKVKNIELNKVSDIKKYSTIVESDLLNKKWFINYQNIDNKILIIVNSNKLFTKNKENISIIINNRKILIKIYIIILL